MSFSKPGHCSKHTTQILLYLRFNVRISGTFTSERICMYDFLRICL